jgi:hypothetical protein
MLLHVLLLRSLHHPRLLCDDGPGDRQGGGRHQFEEGSIV